VHSKFAAGAVRAVIAEGSGHVVQANNEVVGDVRAGTRVALWLAERVRGDVEWRPVALFCNDGVVLGFYFGSEPIKGLREQAHP
jgi:hypothetical protein